MSQKTKKIIWQLITLIGLVVLYYFVEKNEKNYPREADKTDEQAIVSVQTQANLPPETLLKSAVSVDYDTNMANDKFGQHNAPVDYYMLALSWSPAFCESTREANQGNVPQRLQYQCVGDNFGWIIHGLWPQNKNAQRIEDHPRFCQGDLPPVPSQIIQQYLPEAPGAALLQGEWEKHGACAFNDAESYFKKQRELFYSLKLPNKNMPKNELFRWMRKNNPQLDRLYLGASKTELYICYDKKWQPMDCPK